MTPTVRLDAVSTHSRLKAAGHTWADWLRILLVSTHSRLKAAGIKAQRNAKARQCFNTQPPEGGWEDPLNGFQPIVKFQHTAA